MNNLKKFSIYFLCISLICILSACSNKSKSDDNNSDASKSKEEQTKTDDTSSAKEQEKDNSTKKDNDNSNSKDTSDNKQEKNNNSIQNIAINSLLNKEWKPKSAEKFDEKTSTIDSVDMRVIYGSSWHSGGIKFLANGKFEQNIGVYAEISKGTYTVDSENITLKYTSGDYKDNTYVCGYDHSNDGKIMNFILEDEDNNLIRFEAK